MPNLYEQVLHQSRNNLPMKIHRTSGVYLHWHQEYEFIMATGGTALCVINGEPIELKENNALLLQSGDLHLIQKDNNINITAIVVSPSFWADKTVFDLFEGQINFQRLFCYNDPIDLLIINILKDVIKIYDEQRFGYEFMMKAKFTELFSKLLQNNRFSNKPPLSSISYYSKTYIIKLFKKYTDLTPSEYIVQYRLSMAQKMLQTTDKNNLDIAMACGFNSESYFIHAYKKRYKITPQAYRNKIVAKAI